MKKVRFRIRKRYLIQKGLQFRYMGLVLTAMLIAVFIVAWTIYFTHWQILTEQVKDADALMRMTNIFKMINETLLFRLALAMVLVGGVSILLSHRIAGPIYRLEKSAREIAEGNLGFRVRLRKKDELKNLAVALNSVIESQRQLIKDILSRIDKLKDYSSGFPASDETKIFSESLEGLRELLGRYKL